MKNTIITLVAALVVTMSGCAHTKATSYTGKAVVSKNVTK